MIKEGGKEKEMERLYTAIKRDFYMDTANTYEDYRVYSTCLKVF